METMLKLLYSTGAHEQIVFKCNVASTVFSLLQAKKLLFFVANKFKFKISMHFENTDLICLVVIAIKITNIITKKLKCSSYA